MRDEQRDRMLIEIARALELLLAAMAGSTNTTELLVDAANLSHARRTFERNYE